MVIDGLIDGLKIFQGRELFGGMSLSDPKNKQKNPSNSYKPLAQAAKQISQNFSTAEETTLNALAAINPNGQIERVSKQTALSILKKNDEIPNLTKEEAKIDEIPNLTKEEAKIAEAFFKARMLIQEIEKKACKLTQNLLGEEAPIGQIAAGRLQAISHQESLSPPLKSEDTLTPEDVVQIGRESLAEAGGKIQGALYLLQANAEPGEIPPILAAVINAISPQDTTLDEETIKRFLDGKVNTKKLPILDEKKALQNLIFKKDKLTIPDQIDMRGLPGTGLSRTSVDSITGLTAGSSDPTQDLLTLLMPTSRPILTSSEPTQDLLNLPEKFLPKIKSLLDRNKVSENISSD